MRVVCLADTHGFHDKIEVPKGDILIVAGDFTKIGRLREVSSFNFWLSQQNFKHKIIVAGNHDKLFQVDPGIAKIILNEKKVIYLEDNFVEIDNIKFYGSPWSLKFYNWWFTFPKGSEELREKWNLIPDDTDVLITHCPPFGIMDQSMEGVNCGCEILLERIKKINPKYHIFGHIHEEYGQLKQGNVNFINASICTRSYMPINKPIIIDI